MVFDQPTKVYPVLKYLFSDKLSDLSYVCVLDGVFPLVLPFPSYLIVYVIAVQCAYAVIFPVYIH